MHIDELIKPSDRHIRHAGAAFTISPHKPDTACVCAVLLSRTQGSRAEDATGDKKSAAASDSNKQQQQPASTITPALGSEKQQQQKQQPTEGTKKRVKSVAEQEDEASYVFKHRQVLISSNRVLLYRWVIAGCSAGLCEPPSGCSARSNEESFGSNRTHIVHASLMLMARLLHVVCVCVCMPCMQVKQKATWYDKYHYLKDMHEASQEEKYDK